jgi:DNA-binding response OmpR family regulator
MPTILIIEDDEEILQIEKDYLIKENFKVLEAKTGLTGKNTFNTYQEDIDLILLDLNLPGTDGVEVCKQIRKQSGVPIIMVTARTKEIDEILGLNIGADDYIKKPFSPKVLVSRVHALLKRPHKISARDIILAGDIELNTTKRTLQKNGEPIKITTIQFNILQQLMQNPGKAFKRYELIDRMHKDEEFSDIFDRTIDSHIKNIRKLIEKDTRSPKYILTVRGIGYKFNDKI